MKKVLAKNYARALYHSTEGQSEKEVDSLIENFIKLLVKNKSLKLANKIIGEFDKYKKKQMGVMDVRVTSSELLGDTARKELEEKIKQVYKVNQVNLENIESKELIGGIIIKIGDEILDASVSTRLDLLKQQISK